ncbi:MAG: nucleotide exchange factor GrpE [Candidatus Neomarinimicrobiota bacterium]
MSPGTEKKQPAAIRGQSGQDVEEQQVVDKGHDQKKEAAGEQPEKAPAKAKVKTAPADKSPPEKGKITELKDQVKELEGKYLRLRAEYDNHIKRTGKEKDELITYAGTHIFRLILPILDDLRRTVDHARQDEAQKDDPILQGWGLVIDKFVNLLEGEGVHTFTSVGEAFDPQLHEALMTRSSSEHPEGIVLEEFESGYMYRDKVLRHAKVVVSG